MRRLPPQYAPTKLAVEEPSLRYLRHENDYALLRFRRYIETLREFSIYFNPTLRSPMPRSRAEAMLCGLATVSANNHDVDLFVTNGVNGFYSNDPDELADYLIYLCANPERAMEIGGRGRLLAADIFNHDRFLEQWRGLLQELVG